MRTSPNKESRRITQRAWLEYAGAITGGGRFFDRRRPHYRECRRREVDSPADVEVRLSDGTLFASGSARVANVSASGALLTDLRLTRGRFPVGDFRVSAVLRGGLREGITLSCCPVRVLPEGFGLGVRIEDITCSV
jgi:hypothetical protein